MTATAAQRVNLNRFFKTPPPLKGPVELTRRRVSISPTRRGIGFASIVLLLLLTAFIYNNNLLYLLAFLLLSLLLVTILHAYQALAGLSVQAGMMAPVFAGDAALLPLTVSNRSRLPRLAVRAVMNDALEFDVAAHQQKTVMLPVTARKRGWQGIGVVMLDSCYPLGLFRAWADLCFDRQVLVYPKPAAVALPLPFGGGQTVPGQETFPSGGHDDFAGIRAYQAGDSLRMIHWKAYAKGQGLFSKQFSAESGGSELWLDFSKTNAGGTEERLGQLCRWVIDAEQAGQRYGLMLPGRQIAPDRGPKHQAVCLEALALF